VGVLQEAGLGDLVKPVRDCADHATGLPPLNTDQACLRHSAAGWHDADTQAIGQIQHSGECDVILEKRS
jgi:hypothetical protein